ncbi:hypothetical protein [Vreelandella massiliensis]|uniref:hypothetical protein n=1 Tax=Vreelandella massiliensis TaxID=1816686 RepID=UPI0013564DD2|nr:hypothetical protein [Halomonas massiliensis]
MGEKLTSYDAAASLNSEEAIEVFLEDAYKTEDDAYIAKAKEVVERARLMNGA